MIHVLEVDVDPFVSIPGFSTTFSRCAEPSLDEYPAGFQLREFQGRQFGSLYICLEYEAKTEKDLHIRTYVIDALKCEIG